MKSPGVIVTSIVLLIIIIGVISYHVLFSFTSVLKENNFSKEDIIAIDGYSTSLEDTSYMLLLANQDDIGLLKTEKGRFGIWRNTPSISMIDNNRYGDYVTSSIVLQKNWGNDTYSEKHVFIAFYNDRDAELDIKKPNDFYLNIEQFQKNDRKIVYAHAIAGKDYKSFGTDDVLSHINRIIHQ